MEPRKWYKCPTCGKKLLVILPTTRVSNLPFLCKHCKKENLITIEPLSRKSVTV